MKIDEFPNLMVAKKLLAPIGRSQDKLKAIATQADEATNEVVTHGLFVMAVASMETMLNDVIEYFLLSFPQKLPANEFKFAKEAFFDNYFALLHRVVSTYIAGLSYESFDDYFRKALKHFGVEWPYFFDTFGNKIKETKATRNLLLHNALIVNDQYLDSAGPERRESERGKHLKVDRRYLQKAVAVLAEFEEQLKIRLSDKFHEYTKINAAKRLWAYLFKSPVMPFDDFWRYSEESDHITSFKGTDYADFLSGSETLLLSLWLAHFNGNAKYMTQFNMRRFDSNYQEKVFFFLSVAADFDFQ